MIMGREEISRAIQYTERELARIQEEIRRQKENYETLEEFEEKNRESTIRFNADIDRRRKNLNATAALRNASRLIANFFDTVENVLTGQDYCLAQESIGQIEAAVHNKKREVEEQIRELENRRYALEDQLFEQHRAYNQCEEVE